MGQIQAIDASLGQAVEAYNAATVRLEKIQGDLKRNRYALTVARANYKNSQRTLSARLVTIYTSGTAPSTMDVVLGASSLDDLLNRIETVNRVFDQDARVARRVTTFKAQVKRHQAELVRANAAQEQVVSSRAAERSRIQGKLAQRRQLLSSIHGQIAQLQAQERSRSLAAARVAQARLSARPPVSNAGLGIAASTPEASVAPPSRYGGVVGIAMQYLGVPYRWGGASPSGFDCSGFIMYVYGKVGVSLPHYTGSQWGMGVPVSRNDLQAGDLLFFNGLGHAGIYIGGNQMIHAPHTGDVVKISSLTGWYASTYMGARRIL
ncbi:MAG: NlpC/P60 family protein [Actinomycetota bacterium]|nr:NlpC/P60 family protein [Actinomycetota bacterium]